MCWHSNTVLWKAAADQRFVCCVSALALVQLISKLLQTKATGWYGSTVVVFSHSCAHTTGQNTHKETP